MDKSKKLLNSEQIEVFRKTGHLTVHDVFTPAEMAEASADLDSWSQSFLRSLPEEKRSWFLESGSPQPCLRKLDHPVFHRDVFRRMASHPNLVPILHQLIGDGVSVFFSQVFMKPPQVGGPKPIHQDNYYFGPDDLDRTLTVWVALDDATTGNGCLHYHDTHIDEILPHDAPTDEPFNLQIVHEARRHLNMIPEPVPRGGISFHHGNAPHQSSANRSQHPRRAAAFHYLHRSAHLVSPTLRYDESFAVRVS